VRDQLADTVHHSLQIIAEAVKRAVSILIGKGPEIELDALTYTILGFTIGGKLIAHLLCKAVAKSSRSLSAE
jgi:hypothetical protein